MGTKTAKVLQIIAFILILLSMAFVLVGWLVFKDELLGLVSASTADILQAEFTPWGLIIEVGFVLLLALIWLIVLMGKPGRGATIAMTIILSILLIGYYAVGKAFLNAWLTNGILNKGDSMAYIAYTQFNYGASTLMNFAFVPGLFLMILSLGNACGKNYKKQEEPEQSVKNTQTSYTQRPNTQPAYQSGAGRQQYGQQTAYSQQNYGQKPAMQNTGYIPKVDAMQNTGYIPKVDAMQNTGYIPKVDAMQNTGYIPKVDVPQNTGIIPPVTASQPAKTESTPVIYPWMKAAGAPEQKAAEEPVKEVEETVETVDEILESEV